MALETGHVRIMLRSWDGRLWAWLVWLRAGTSLAIQLMRMLVSDFRSRGFPGTLSTLPTYFIYTHFVYKICVLNSHVLGLRFVQKLLCSSQTATRMMLDLCIRCTGLQYELGCGLQQRNSITLETWLLW